VVERDTHSGKEERDANCEACPCQVIGCPIVSQYSAEMRIIVNQLATPSIDLFFSMNGGGIGGQSYLVFVREFSWTDMAREIAVLVLGRRCPSGEFVV